MDQGSGQQRRWQQFGLRSILLLTLFMAALFAVTRAYLDPYFAQSSGIRTLKNHLVTLRTARTLPAQFQWLGHLESHGEDLFCEVVHLDMTAGDFADEHLRHLLAMRCLQTLTVRGADFDRTDLQSLVRLPQLRLVVLDATGVKRHEAETLAAESGVKIRLSQRAVFEVGLQRLQALNRKLGSSRAVGFGQSGGWSCRTFALDDRGSQCVAATRTHELDLWRKQAAGGHDLGIEHWLDVDSMTLVSPGDDMLAGLSSAHSTRQLNLVRSRLTANGLRKLTFMHRLQRMSLSFAEVEPSLAELSQYPTLTHLFLADAGVTDESLCHLRTLDRLRVLNLNANAIRGDGLMYLEQLPLEELSLSRTKLNHTGVRALAELTTLRRLELADTTLDSHAVSLLKPLVGLERLVLRRTRVDDSALQHLAEMVTLESLSLQNTAIDGSQLMCLASLTKLRHLDLSLTRVSDDQVERLKEQIPELTVSR